MYPLFAILVSLTLVALFILILRSLFFTGGGRGNVPEPDEVREKVLTLDNDARVTIENLKAHYQSALPENTFSTICLATALSIKQPLANLMKSITIAEYIDSLTHVEFIMLIEDLVEIEIPDEKASNILTFTSLLSYVESATANK